MLPNGVGWLHHFGLAELSFSLLDHKSTASKYNSFLVDQQCCSG